MNLHKIPKIYISYLPIYVIISFTMCSCGNYSHKQEKQKDVQSGNCINVYWLKSHMCIYNKKYDPSEGYRKLHIDIVFQNYLRDTLNISLFTIKNGKNMSFFLLTFYNKQINIIDTIYLNTSSNKEFVVLKPFSSDTLSFSCSLNTFDYNEAVLKAHRISEECNLI